VELAPMPSTEGKASRAGRIRGGPQRDAGQCMRVRRASSEDTTK
jgi:hypothetical protein